MVSGRSRWSVRARPLDRAIECSRGNGRNAPPQLELKAEPEASDGRCRRQQHSDAKTVSVVCLLPPIRAAAALVIAIDRAVAKDATNEEKEGSNVERALKHLGVTLSSFTIREAVRDLGADDRTMYLEIVAFLSTLLSVSEHGASKPGSERNKVELSALAKLFKILNRFDAGLAEEMASVESLKKRSSG
jgi:hypothetical protein